MFTRYAIFYTAPPGDFCDFCTSWLGWDSRTGKTVAHPTWAEIDVAALTAVPRKYGFHGTLKAPFRLRDGETTHNIKDMVDRCAATIAPIRLDGLELGHNHGFLALRPKGDVRPLQQLAIRIVTDFDRFRAPTSKAELARRSQVGLTERQDHNLMTWGYPFVMEDFEFHLTLSGPIDDQTAQTVTAKLGSTLTPVLPAPFIIDAITLMGQTDDGMFYEIHRATFAG